MQISPMGPGALRRFYLIYNFIFYVKMSVNIFSYLTYKYQAHMYLKHKLFQPQSSKDISKSFLRKAGLGFIFLPLTITFLFNFCPVILDVILGSTGEFCIVLFYKRKVTNVVHDDQGFLKKTSLFSVYPLKKREADVEISELVLVCTQQTNVYEVLQT